MKPRVVITGMGIVSPLGHGVPEVWQAIMDGKSGAAPTTIFDASTFPTTFGAEVKNYDLAQFVENPDWFRDGNRGSQFVTGAAAQACRQAGVEIETDSPSDGIDRTRLGVYLGAGEGSVDNNAFFAALVSGWNSDDRSMDWSAWTETALDRMTAARELHQEANMPVSFLSLLTGARGPVRSCLTACAASTQAVGEAMKIIQRGDADLMIAGGAHSMIHPLGVMGFNRLTALSTRNESPETASRPFSGSRDGFVLGEGAAVLIIETLESAQKRGATILAELIGYGSTADAFRVTDMHEDARGGIAALKAALADAGVTPADIDYINAHGTSTNENDSVETKAIKGAMGEQAQSIPVSSVKGSLGHLIGAAGAAELITCVMALQNQTIPPTAHLNDPDPQLDLDYVPNEPRKAELNIVINESFGFGGQNNVLVVKRWTKK